MLVRFQIGFLLFSLKVKGPPAAGAFKERPTKPTAFRKFYERGDFPIALEHDSKGNKIAWKVSRGPAGEPAARPPAAGTWPGTHVWPAERGGGPASQGTPGQLSPRTDSHIPAAVPGARVLSAFLRTGSRLSQAAK